MSRSQWLSPVPEGVANPAARQAGWQLSGPSEYSHLQQVRGGLQYSHLQQVRKGLQGFCSAG